MATTTMDAPRELQATAGIDARIGSLAGVAFALLLFLGVAMLEVPEQASDAELVAWWSDRGHQTTAVISMYCFVAAALCFLVFLSALGSRLRTAGTATGGLTTLVTLAGGLFAAMLLVAAAARGVIGFSALSPVADESLPGADTLRYLPQVGYAVTGSGGMLAAALTIAATSWLVLRAGVLPRWLAWVGIVAALVVVGACATLAGVFAIPAVHVWALAASVALWRAPRRASASA